MGEPGATDGRPLGDLGCSRNPEEPPLIGAPGLCALQDDGLNQAAPRSSSLRSRSVPERIVALDTRAWQAGR